MNIHNYSKLISPRDLKSKVGEGSLFNSYYAEAQGGHYFFPWLLIGWLVSLFNGISTFVGYSMPNPFSKKNSSGTI